MPVENVQVHNQRIIINCTNSEKREKNQLTISIVLNKRKQSKLHQKCIRLKKKKSIKIEQ